MNPVIYCIGYMQNMKKQRKIANRELLTNSTCYAIVFENANGEFVTDKDTRGWPLVEYVVR